MVILHEIFRKKPKNFEQEIKLHTRDVIQTSRYDQIAVVIDIQCFSGIVHFMEKQKLLLSLVFIGIAILACTNPVGGEPFENIRFQDTATVFIPPTLVPTPSQTPVPTLVPAVQIKNADRAFFNGDWETALSEYQDAFESNSGLDNEAEMQAAALLGIGRTQFQAGHYPEALDTLLTLIASYPESSQTAAAYFATAQTYEALTQYGEADNAYSQYLALRPGVIDSYVNEWRGDVLVQGNEPLKAIDAYQAAITAPRLEDTLALELKVANAYAILGDHSTALVAYQDIYTRTTNDYTRAQLDYLMGASYTAIGQIEDANAVYLDAVENYPLSFDSYQALIILVDSGYPVNEFDRGLVDYFAGQYNLAITAFDRYLQISTENAGTAYYYEGLAYRDLDNPESAIASWELLIKSYLADDYWDDAWEEVAYTQWAYLDQYSEAIQTLLDFVSDNPDHSRASEFLFEAARIAERKGDYERAASIWERIPSEYPSSEFVPKAIFQAGLSHFRTGDYATALSTFEWSLNSSADPEKKSAAYFWMAKSYQALGDQPNAEAFWGIAANQDPTGYYSERARDILVGREPFEPPTMFDLAFNIEADRSEAESWMREVFAIPGGIDLSGPGPLEMDLRFIRGTELWNLGLYELAQLEFESLRADNSQSPMDNYRLANYLVDLGLYRSAIFATRQVLDLNDMDDAQTLTAPVYFNHLRFGSYYRDLVLPIADTCHFHPLFLFSVLRQESLFEGFVRSSAGARGLMQIMPKTAESIAANAGWPPDFTPDDLYRPIVNLTLGADYLDTQRNFFDGDLYAALAAYNAGPGNTIIWRDLAGGDIDLFLEIIRFDETRDYIKGIYEVFSIYRLLYDRSP
jgi:soluble lytic murein transglycosylase